MKIDQFLYKYSELVATDFGESVFATLNMICPGMSSPKLGKILNYAVSRLEKGEFYCEIGTHCGYTLIAAAYNNRSKCVGIDHFKLYGEKTSKKFGDLVRAKLKSNLGTFVSPSYVFIDQDYENVVFGPDDKMGVFFIDGKHTREEVYKNFTWAHKYLADNALIVLDDISTGGVGEGVKDWIKDHGDEYVEFFHMDSFYPDSESIMTHWSPIFWNGLSMLTFRKK